MSHGVEVEDARMIINYNENIMLYHSDEEDKPSDKPAEEKEEKSRRMKRSAMF